MKVKKKIEMSEVSVWNIDAKNALDDSKTPAFFTQGL